MALGKLRTHHDQFVFNVEIDAVRFPGFNKVTGLKATHEPVEYWEGGDLYPIVTPGLAKFEPVTLERAASLDPDLLLWFESVGNSVAQIGLPPPGQERTVDIIQLDRAGIELERWRLLHAWPTEYSPGDWSKESNKRMEVTVIRFQRMLYLPQASPF